MCGVQSWRQRSRRGGSEGTGVVSGRSDGSTDTGVRGMSAMGAGCVCGVHGGVHGVCGSVGSMRGCVWGGHVCCVAESV